MRTKTIAAIIGSGALSAALLGLGAAGAGTETAGARSTETAAAAQTYQVDAAHTSVVFRVKHLGIAYFMGRFNDVSGSFTLDQQSPGSSSISISVNAESVDTNSDRRDNHLRSPDFFNARQFPEITFTSTGITRDSNGDFVVEGDLTLLGETRPVTVKIRKTGEGDTPMGRRAGFETSFDIRRSDYGMSWGVDNGALGNEVRLMISVEGTAG